jgi:hypothetical protein
VRVQTALSSSGIATVAGSVLVLAATLGAKPARADIPPAAPPPPELSEQDAAHLNFSTEAPEGKTAEQDAHGKEGEALGLAPPPRPRHSGLVLESTLGALGFAGQFRHVSPTAYWLHGQLGYEILPWLMVFGEGELALTDTSESQDESHNLGFAMFGFGGGVRVTVHASERVAIYGQGDAGALMANVPHGALALLGFREAESLGAQFGGRLGVDWYQVDRHMALCAAFGGRLAEGFAKKSATSDVPLLWDFGAGVRYTF